MSAAVLRASRHAFRAAIVVCLAACGGEEPRPKDATAATGHVVRATRPFTASARPTAETWLRTPPPPLPALPSSPSFGAASRTLAGGTRVLVVERHDFPSVAVSFVLDRGTCGSGAAAALYGASFGTDPGHTRYQNLSYLRDVSAPMSQFVLDDYVVMRTTVLSPLLESAMSRLVPMFLAPGLDDDDLRAARDRWRDLLSPASARQEVLAERALRRSLFGPVGYGAIPVQRGEIDAEEDARVRKFRTAALSLRHVRVVAVGDVTADAFTRMLERYMPAAPPSTESSTSTCGALPVAPRDGDVHVVDDPGAVQSRVHIGAVGVPAGHPDGEALDVASAVLGDSVSSRLGLKIREEHGYTYGVTMRSHQWRSHGLVDVVTSVDADRTVEAIQGLLAELDRAVTEPFDPTELAAATRGTRAFGGAHWMAARELEKIAAYDLPADEPVRAAERRSKLTAEDLRRVTARYLARPQRVITVVGDASKIVPALRKAGIGHVVLAGTP